MPRGESLRLSISILQAFYRAMGHSFAFFLCGLNGLFKIQNLLGAAGQGLF